MELSFLGAAGTVTGSKYLLSWSGRKILIDCGLFQGLKQLRLKNWAPIGVDPRTVDAVALTHAHIDHSGYLPLLVKNGFRGSVLCSQPTRDLCEILLKDSAFLQEKDAAFANKHGFSKHHPALPLYTQKDAEEAIKFLRPVSFGRNEKLLNGTTVKFHEAGHILGAAIVELNVEGKRIIFSGDLGRANDPVMKTPRQIFKADYLVVESTYGNRKHSAEDVEQKLADLINSTTQRGGKVIIPAFAVGRTQSMLFMIEKLIRQKRIQELPVFLDSPMAINATELYCKYDAYHRLSHEEIRRACNIARYTRTVEDSKELSFLKTPAIILSASGMATGGRILHHIKQFAPDRRNLILFTGFLAEGTRGRAMVEGTDKIKMHGEYIPINAQVENLEGLSAHADADGIMDWLRHLEQAPIQTFVTHGEPTASSALAERIQSDLGWTVSVPMLGDKVHLP